MVVSYLPYSRLEWPSQMHYVAVVWKSKNTLLAPIDHSCLVSARVTLLGIQYLVQYLNQWNTHLSVIRKPNLFFGFWLFTETSVTSETPNLSFKWFTKLCLWSWLFTETSVTSETVKQIKTKLCIWCWFFTEMSVTSETPNLLVIGKPNFFSDLGFSLKRV